MDLSNLDMSGPAPDVPDPSKIPLKDRLDAVDRAMALPVRTPEAVADAVGPAMLKECPAVCAMLANPAADLTQLREVLAKAYDVQTGRQTKAKVERRLGKRWFDEYVQPRLG